MISVANKCFIKNPYTIDSFFIDLNNKTLVIKKDDSEPIRVAFGTAEECQEAYNSLEKQLRDIQEKDNSDSYNNYGDFI